MDAEKIGKFIKLLREEQKLTQEALANMVPISRQAISKWERGVGIPDSLTLIRLSEIFKVSINEILLGKRLNKDNNNEVDKLSINLLDKLKKRKKVNIVLFISIIMLLFTFLVYYFIITYKSVKIYTVTGSTSNLNIYDGMFIKTKEKVYFTLGNITNNSGKDITSLRLYYKEDGRDKEICYNTTDNMVFVDFPNYNGYLNLDNIEYIMKNMYLDIQFIDNTIETLNLNFQEDYTNDYLFYFKRDESTTDQKAKIENNITSEDIKIMAKIREKYKYEDGSYLYQDGLFNYIFYDDLKIIVIIKMDDVIREEWHYLMQDNFIIYDNHIDSYQCNSYKKDISCNMDNCNICEDKINEFYDYLLATLE